jgi:hypothetical protein
LVGGEDRQERTTSPVTDMSDISTVGLDLRDESIFLWPTRKILRNRHGSPLHMRLERDWYASAKSAGVIVADDPDEGNAVDVVGESHWRRVPDVDLFRSEGWMTH